MTELQGKVFTITSGKGGVGKTTTSANLSIALAKLGKRVVVIDADVGLRNLDVVMGLENRIVYDLVDVVERRAKLRQAMIRHKVFPNMYLIPAAQTRDKMAVSPADMLQIVNKLREGFEYIIIDSPAGIERGFRNALAPATDVIIVTNPEISAVRDADRIIGLVEAEKKPPPKLILNRAKAHMIERGDMLSPEDVTDILSIELLGIVPEDEAVIPSTNSGVPIVLNKDSQAGAAFNRIARRLMGENIPIEKLVSEKGFMQRISRWFGG